MRSINILTLILVIVGGLNWGLVGLFEFDLVATLFGAGSALARIVYILVGVSALWQIGPLMAEFGQRPREASARAERGRGFPRSLRSGGPMRPGRLTATTRGHFC